MKPLISLVIPVYNVEKYLRKCLDSVLSQTYRNYEVIVVDDGSTDNSGSICDEYAAKDTRIKVYHKKNRGLSDARNFGVEHSEADLISFIDSDDYVTEDYLEYLWYLMKKNECDISCAGLKRVSEGKSFSIKNRNITEIKLGTEQALKKICCTSFAAWGKMYKKRVLLKHKFPVGRLYEDIATVYKLVNECDSVAFSDKQIYIWVQREGSITHSGISERQMDIFWALDGLYDFICRDYPACKDAASFRYILEIIEFLGRIFSCCEKFDRRMYFEIAQKKALPHLNSANKCKEATFRYKMASIGIYNCYLAYKSLYELRKIQKKIFYMH